LVITSPTTLTDTTVTPIEIPIIAPTIPPYPDYTTASPDYSPASDTESNPSEDPSLDHIPPLPAISSFLSSADDTTDSDTPDTPPSPTHDSSSEASSDFHSDASSDSSSRHSLSDHSSPDLPSTFAGPSRKRRRSPMTFVPALRPVSGALSPVCADLVPSPKKFMDSSYLAYAEVDPRETSLRDDIMVRGSDEPHLEQDINPEIQAEIDDCFAYADALRDRGIAAKVVVEAVDLEESETGTRGPVESGDGGIVGAMIGISMGVTVVSVRVVGEVITSVVSRIVIGIVPNKITHPTGVPTLSLDKSDKTKITEIAMTCTSKVYINHLYINHA
nr:hypothetical protein [Tanacetum cinerariifolium]